MNKTNMIKRINSFKINWEECPNELKICYPMLKLSSYIAIVGFFPLIFLVSLLEQGK